MDAFGHGLGDLCVENTNFPLHFSFSEISKNYIRFLSGKICTLSKFNLQKNTLHPLNRRNEQISLFSSPAATCRVVSIYSPVLRWLCGSYNRPTPPPFPPPSSPRYSSSCSKNSLPRPLPACPAPRRRGSISFV